MLMVKKVFYAKELKSAMRLWHTNIFGDYEVWIFMRDESVDIYNKV